MRVRWTDTGGITERLGSPMSGPRTEEILGDRFAEPASLGADEFSKAVMCEKAKLVVLFGPDVGEQPLDSAQPEPVSSDAKQPCANPAPAQIVPNPEVANVAPPQIDAHVGRRQCEPRRRYSRRSCRCGRLRIARRTDRGFG